MADYRIEIGAMRFEAPEIILSSINMATAVDIVGAEMSADEFTVTLYFKAGETFLFSPADYDGILTSDGYLFGTADVTSGDLTTVPYGTPLNFYDGADLVARFFVRGVQRIGREKYQVSAMSAVGMLEYTQHMGGVYNGKYLGDVIDDIIGGTFTYSPLNELFRYQRVVGWLPIDSGRANLHRLLFAFGVALKKNAAGDLVFTRISSSSPISVPDSRIFIGGEVNYPAQVTAVEVVEHLFYRDPAAEREEVFSSVGAAPADNTMIAFSEPFFDLTADGGLTIDEYGDNYAIVSGVGTLYGKKYGHDTNTVRKSVSGSTAVVPNVVTSSEDCLINSMNSATVVDRLVAYYGSRKTVNADIMFNGEKAGDAVTFNDAFGEASTGIISRMDLTASSFVRASCEVVTDYTPPSEFGNVYNNKLVISSSGAWLLPSVTNIRVVLIQGGVGGQGGFKGEDGRGGSTAYGGDMTKITDSYQLRYYYASEQKIAKGGAPGLPGAGGKVRVFDLEINPRETCTVSIGQGGAGGEAEGGMGTVGGETTITIGGVTYSSADGSNDRPFYDPFSVNVYGAEGDAGIAGGDGGQTDIHSLAAYEGYSGFPGGNAGNYSGGTAGAGYSDPDPAHRYYDVYASGGGGGGGAYGSPGSQGGAGGYDQSGRLYGGTGGDGGNAAAPSTPTVYGQGGGGGNGGGAGGNSGGCQIIATEGTLHGDHEIVANEGGSGGNGSTGGAGANGACFIYY